MAVILLSRVYNRADYPLAVVRHTMGGRIQVEPQRVSADAKASPYYQSRRAAVSLRIMKRISYLHQIQLRATHDSGASCCDTTYVFARSTTWAVYLPIHTYYTIYH